ncbi:unnamed protein product [Rotaria sp. Silwood2]|nr:unnamed protein product [Rotaria sp. Silwood2]CAF3021694.1 unnamed protein product [Rotaria sp. Silwood2]CAF4197533.1 unnamed protein product [Rotaria sp. Silwood2]CAF4291859.1 unnamed protein product [Rotaria sp. Silwood2]
MQFNQVPLTPVASTVVKFGIFFLSALAVITIGVAVGIGVGNLAHYKYFPPNNQTNVDYTYLNNITLRRISTNTTGRTSYIFNEGLKKRAITAKNS